MNPDHLPALAQSLRTLGEFAARHEVDDVTLGEIAAELDRARQALTGARGAQRANRCVRHPGGPVDPTAAYGCLLCGAAQRRTAAPPPEPAEPGEVLRYLAARGEEATAARYGARALARALAIGARHPSTVQRGAPARQYGDDTQPEPST